MDFEQYDDECLAQVECSDPESSHVDTEFKLRKTDSFLLPSSCSTRAWQYFSVSRIELPHRRIVRGTEHAKQEETWIHTNSTIIQVELPRGLQIERCEEHRGFEGGGGVSGHYVCSVAPRGKGMRVLRPGVTGSESVFPRMQLHWSIKRSL